MTILLSTYAYVYIYVYIHIHMFGIMTIFLSIDTLLLYIWLLLHDYVFVYLSVLALLYINMINKLMSYCMLLWRCVYKVISFAVWIDMLKVIFDLQLI